MGHLSRDAGAAFETAIVNKLTVLRQQRIVARFQKNEVAFRLRGKRDQAKSYQPTDPAGADFSGMLVGSGLAFSLEAKSTGMDKQTGKLGEFILEDRIPKTQLEDLVVTAQEGGLSMLSLQFRPDLEPWQTFILPWEEVPWRLRKINHSVAMHEIPQRYRVVNNMVLFEHLICQVGSRWELRGAAPF